MRIPSRPEEIEDELTIHPVAWTLLGLIVFIAAYVYLSV